MEGVELKNVKTGEVFNKEVQGFFVFIGTRPNTGLVNGLIKLDKNGFIITGQDMETSVPGLFAAGDIRAKLLRQIATAVGDGATASFAVEKYLEGLQHP